MKKIVSLFLAIICIAGLWSCAALNSRPLTLAATVEIPENGIIEASVFDALMQENKAGTFVGKSGEIRYTWTVFGSDIDEAKDRNLGIEITEIGSEQITFRYLSDEDFGFSPVLSIYLNERWEVPHALVYAVTEDGTEEVCQAEITGSEHSILNFSPYVHTGTYIVALEAEETTQPETESAPESQHPAPLETTAPPAPVQTKKPISDGSTTEQDPYKTDPVPAGKPLPAEPEEQTVDTRKEYTCTFSIECSSILNNLADLELDKLDVLPKNGVIFAAQTVTFYEGESVFDLLQRICRENNIHMESSWTPMYNSAYIEGIHNLYEFDCGSGSGWMYQVNGWYPNYGCSRYQLSSGDTVEWRYTCDLGADIGGANAIN